MAASIAGTLALIATLIADGSPALIPPEPTADPRVEQDTANPLVVAGTSLAVLGVLSAWAYGAWWGEDFRSFHFKDTGFLNRDTYAGGSDKLGHAYATYLSTIAATRMYEALGMTHLHATFLSASAVMLASNGVELTDGFTDYGFEYGDVITNTLGIAMAVASDLSPEFASMFGWRIGYVPSRDFLAHDKTFIKWVNDYTGMLFYFDVKVKGVLEQLGYDPGIFKYVIAGPVWGTDRYSPVRVHEERRRSLGFQIGLSLPEILRAAFPDDRGVAAYATFFDYYAMPLLSVALLSDLNTGDWFINFGISNRFEIEL